MVRLRSRPRRPRWQMTNRSTVAVALGVAGLAVAAAQALLLSSPPTWFQLAVVAFWTLVGGAYLASGLGQRVRARWGPRRHRIPDGEVSTGGPEPDADTTRGADVDRDAHPARPAAGPAPGGPPPAGSLPAAPRAEDDDATAVVPPLATSPVRAARPRDARPRTRPFALPGERPAAPLAGVAGRPAPPPLSGAAPSPPPNEAETTDTRMAPWPHAASPVAPPARPATPPARPETRPTAVVAPVPAAAVPAAPVPAAPPTADPTAALPVVRQAHASDAPASDAPASDAPATSRPVTSPSFAIRAARPPFSFGAAASTPPSSGRHAVPEAEPEVQPAGTSRHRRRHRAAHGGEATMAGSATASRTERTHRRRAS